MLRNRMPHHVGSSVIWSPIAVQPSCQWPSPACCTNRVIEICRENGVELPVFRSDDGTELESPWLLSLITCVAPCAPDIGQPESGDLLQERIHRVLAIAHAYGCSCLVLGAWGCGAFENDPRRTAQDFCSAIDNGRGFGESFGGMLGASPQTPGRPSTGFAECVGWL